ncbi:unnamed protein product, partial [marine sediment metagenome]
NTAIYVKASIEKTKAWMPPMNKPKNALTPGIVKTPKGMPKTLKSRIKIAGTTEMIIPPAKILPKRRNE